MGTASQADDFEGHWDACGLAFLSSYSSFVKEVARASLPNLPWPGALGDVQLGRSRCSCAPPFLATSCQDPRETIFNRL